MNGLIGQRGLSLLELLVVLVIVGLVSTLLLQGLGFGLSLFERVHTRGESAKQEILHREWFRGVNESLVARPEASGVSLLGDSSSIDTQTLSPLLGAAGVPRAITWRIEDETLWYEESGYVLPIMPVPPDAAFRFRNGNGNWSLDWPPETNTENLPLAIALEHGANRVLVASLRVRDVPDLLLEDSRRERE